MAQESTRFTSRCKLLMFGLKPLTRRDLSPFLARHFPLSTPLELTEFKIPRDFGSVLNGTIPSICLVEIPKGDPTPLKLICDLLQYSPKLAIAAILPPNDPDLILRSLRAGANDFLIPPFTAEHVQAVAQKLIQFLPENCEPAPSGKVYCVIPAKGACGASTIAADLVYQYKRLGASRVLLADLDPLTGVISFLLKTSSSHSFVDILQRAGDMDEDLWKGTITNRQGVDLLLAPDMPADSMVPLDDAGPILEYARFHYDVVVADAGSAYGDWTLSQASLSDEVLLVTTNELPALQAAQRVLHYLQSNGIGAWKIRLVVNRFDPNIGLGQDAIASALQTEVWHVIPSDYNAVQNALLDGKLISASSRFGKSMAVLGDRLAGRSEPNKKASSFGGLLSLFSRISVAK
jgi:pilus assembly protein CpaE